MANHILSVEATIKTVQPAARVPKILRGLQGKVIRPEYGDCLLPDGFCFEFESELDEEIFLSFAQGISEIREALITICNRFGVLCGPLSVPLEIGEKLPRAHETVWHVDRSADDCEYFALLSPDVSTRAKTWVSPLIHFLRVSASHMKDGHSQKILEDIHGRSDTTGAVTDRITEIAESMNKTLNGHSIKRKMSIRMELEKHSVLKGGKNGWLLFSDPLVIHNANQPHSDDKYIFTYDIARKAGGTFYTTYQ